MELRKARQSMGMIFQSFNLLEQRNVFKNVLYPLEIAGVDKNISIERATKLLEVVGLSEKAKAYPAQLSGGQKQRVAIARALATNPKVLLCDEATSALDPNTTSSILALLQSINKDMGVTIVIVTHEMHVIEKICDRVAVVDKGDIVELSTVNEIFKNPKSKVAKNFILPKAHIDYNISKQCIRIVFDGNSSFEPVISGLSLYCNVLLNILYANTKDIDGKAFGEMLLQLPEDKAAVSRILAYLDEKQILYREEEMEDAAKND